MSGILVVERSTTLKHLLQRTMQAAQVGSWAELDSYADTLDHLQRARDLGQPYALVILGAPARMTRDFDDLLLYLRNPRELKVPVLLLAHERTADLATFLTARPETQFLLWANFSKIPAVIRQAVGAAPAPAASAPEPNRIDRAKAEIARSEQAAQERRPATTAAPTTPTASTPAPGIVRKAAPTAVQATAVEPTPASTPSDDTPHKEPNGIHVLFVDDSASVRLAYKHLLERNGYGCDVAASIGEALTKAQAQQFDLFVLDYFLPDGNGDELCRRLHAMSKYRDTPVAIITSTYREDIIRKSLEAGALECTFKNEAKELFLARIRSLASQVLMHKQVLAEKQRLGGILGSVGDGVYGVDAYGMLSFINPTALRLLGHDEESALIGMRAHDAIHHSDDQGSTIREADSRLAQAYRSGEQINRLETFFFDRDRRIVPVECSVHPLMFQGKRDGAVVVFRDISERKTADRLKWELSHDNATGLFNARHFTQLLSLELGKRREAGGYSAVLYIDIDRFTHIVDIAGSEAADQILVDYGQMISKRLRDGDVLARLEADRLALLLTNVQLDNLFTVADGFRELARQVFYPLNRLRRHATASVGVAVLSRDTPSPEYVIEHARVACRSAKHRGRDQTQIYVGEHDVRVARELEAGWISRFKEAIEENRFEFAAQPIVPITDVLDAPDSPEGSWRLGSREHEVLFELLIRMRERKGEFVSPAVFVPLAERVGMMSKIDLWGVRHVLAVLLEKNAFAGRVAFSINLSNQTLADTEAMSTIADLIKSTGVPPKSLVFEITETSEMTSMHLVRKHMNLLRGLGCRFALDDFGTGFSSFTHLRHLPVDFVKVEGSFVEGMADNDLDHTMVSSIVNLAKSMKLAVIGEHVDSAATLSSLRASGAEYAQGHYLGAPKKLADLDFSKF